jgi:hypothetical protein
MKVSNNRYFNNHLLGIFYLSVMLFTLTSWQVGGFTLAVGHITVTLTLAIYLCYQKFSLQPKMMKLASILLIFFLLHSGWSTYIHFSDQHLYKMWLTGLIFLFFVIVGLDLVLTSNHKAWQTLKKYNLLLQSVMLIFVLLEFSFPEWFPWKKRIPESGSVLRLISGTKFLSDLFFCLAGIKFFSNQ